MNLYTLFCEQAARQGSHPAVEMGDGASISFAELASLSLSLLGWLHAAGVGRCSKAGVMLPRNPEHIAAVLALLGLGAAIVPLRRGLPAETLRQECAGLELDVLLTTSGCTDWLAERQLHLDHRLPGASTADPRQWIVADAAECPALLGQSSGTTGNPKRFFINQGQWQRRVELTARLFPDTAHRRNLLEGDLALFSSLIFLMNELQFGGTVVIESPASLEDYVRVIRSRAITDTFFLPQRLARLLAQATPGQVMFPTLRAVVTSAALAPELKVRGRELVAPGLWEAYASNEAGWIAVDLPWQGDHCPGTVGKLVPWMEAEIVDDDGRVLPFGETGQLRLRNHVDIAPASYRDNPEASARHFRDGWFYPGDALSMNGRGHLFFHGRTDDVINRGGVKFYPVEIENVLRRHPAVEEAAVTHWPDPAFGQVALAFVQLATPVEQGDLTAWCRRFLGSKAPDRIAVVQDMPRTPNRKILKRVLREQYAGLVQGRGAGR